MTNRYDEKLKKERMERDERSRLTVEAERTRFEARMRGQKPKLRIKHGAWTNALEDPPFGSGLFTWQLTLNFPFKVAKDEKLKRFEELIQRGFEKTFLT